MFITFEGIEGSGKSTLIKGVAESLEQGGREVVLTREPGGSRLGRDLRAILLDPANTDISGRAELFLYLADRAQHVHQVIKPALAKGAFVLCDRFADSTVAYQGYGRGLDKDLLDSLNQAAMAGVLPQATILLDLAPETGLSRARRRNAESEEAAKEGRFEDEAMAFHNRIREGYLEMAAREPERFHVVDADQTPDKVLEAVLGCISELPGW